MKDLRQVEKTTGKPPRELVEWPELWPENQTAWECWQLLCGLGAIRETAVSLTEIETFARLRCAAPLRLAGKLAAIRSAWLERLEQIKKEADSG